MTDKKLMVNSLPILQDPSYFPLTDNHSMADYLPGTEVILVDSVRRIHLVGKVVSLAFASIEVKVNETLREYYKEVLNLPSTTLFFSLKKDDSRGIAQNYITGVRLAGFTNSNYTGSVKDLFLLTKDIPPFKPMPKLNQAILLTEGGIKTIPMSVLMENDNLYKEVDHLPVYIPVVGKIPKGVETMEKIETIETPINIPNIPGEGIHISYTVDNGVKVTVSLVEGSSEYEEVKAMFIDQALADVPVWDVMEDLKEAFPSNLKQDTRK